MHAIGDADDDDEVILVVVFDGMSLVRILVDI